MGGQSLAAFQLLVNSSLCLAFLVFCREDDDLPRLVSAALLIFVGFVTKVTVFFVYE